MLKSVEIKTFAVARLSSAPNILTVITMFTMQGMTACKMRTEATIEPILKKETNFIMRKTINKTAGTTRSLFKDRIYIILIVKQSFNIDVK